MNNLKTKVDDLDFGKLTIVHVHLKKISDVWCNELVKKSNINILEIKVNNLENKIVDGTIIIHINQYNTGKQNLERKIGYVDRRIPYPSGLLTTTVLNTKISEGENKIPNTSDLVTTTVLNTKISEVHNKIPNHDKYITTPELNKLTTENFTAWLKQANLVTKTYFDKKLTNEVLIVKLPQIKRNI